jgi:uracil-DNA glycosylase
MEIITHKLEDKTFTTDYKDLLFDWAKPLSKNLLSTNYMNNLAVFVDQFYQNNVNVYPIKNNLFSAFKLTPFKDLKVVCFGSRPDYLSNGLAYSAYSDFKNTITPIRTQQIINCVNKTLYPEVHQEFDNSMKFWASQGVLMLNSTLTSKFGEDHRVYWRNFIRQVIFTINEEKENVIFLFLHPGNETFKKYIDVKKHYVFENKDDILNSEDPIFIQVNNMLRAEQIKPVVW